MPMYYRALGVLLASAAISGCCKSPDKSKVSSTSSSTGVAAVPSSEGEETPVPVGKFSGVPLAEFERRAKKAGWRVVSSASEDTEMTLELDDKKHFAYVTVIDVPPSVKKGEGTATSKIGDTRAIGVRLDAEPGSKLRVEDALASLLAKAPLETATRETVVSALQSLKWKIDNTAKGDEDGLVTTRIDAARPDGTVLEVDLYDFTLPKKQGRIAIDGTRLMSVFVCRDCTKKEKRITAEVWQTHKAKVLLGKLSNP